jgi:hypothetical protein
VRTVAHTSSTRVARTLLICGSLCKQGNDGLIFPGFRGVIKDKSAAHRQQDLHTLKTSGVVVGCRRLRSTQRRIGITPILEGWKREMGDNAARRVLWANLMVRENHDHRSRSKRFMQHSSLSVLLQCRPLSSRHGSSTKSVSPEHSLLDPAIPLR